MANMDQSIATSKHIRTRIRQAREDEANLLTALTLRSKAHWGYDGAFMADAVEDLTFRVAKFQPDFHVYVIEEQQKIIGFCSLVPIDVKTVELFDLFVEPEFIGKGYGKQLWDHAVTIARRHHFKLLVLTADPFAEVFYLRQGAARTGEKASNIRPDRMLPLMTYAL
ncbi:MAG TPA: GNAT family N-acetyltransferase [Candidatus Dormibacteraeota bacterium]|nr:GNAT family N-acetyltransferase [Candidatus Dormibacteraeota bacterium]